MRFLAMDTPICLYNQVRSIVAPHKQIRARVKPNGLGFTVAFDNKRGICERWRVRFKWRAVVPLVPDHRGGPQLHALISNLGNFLRTLATPEPIEDWSRTRLKEGLIKIGAKSGEPRPLRRIAGAQALPSGPYQYAERKSRRARTITRDRRPRLGALAAHPPGGQG
jgi:hypothetical protein